MLYNNQILQALCYISVEYGDCFSRYNWLEFFGCNGEGR